MQISIFGYGVTTKPLVSFLNKQGLKLCIYDDKFSAPSTDECGNALLPSADFKPDKSELEILSPGIPPYHSLVKKARNLVSEYDYFEGLLRGDFKHKDSTLESTLTTDSKAQSQNAESSLDSNVLPYMIYISGTNGKTTTTEMTTLLLEPFGARAGGNIGTPLAELYTQKDAKIWVLETSSFSLHYTKIAAPRIYALLPVREDHITWHGSFENYILDKLSVLPRMSADSHALIPAELSEHKSVASYKGNLITYSSSADLAQKLGIEAESIAFKEPFLLDSLLALGIAKLSFKADDIARLNTFRLGAHRIAEFYDSTGRLWVDDSKGTNVDATIEALRRYEDKNVLLILGGDDKGANLTPLFEFMVQKSQKARLEIVSIGANEPRLVALAQEYGLPLMPKGNLASAMDYIRARRNSGKSKDFQTSQSAESALDSTPEYGGADLSLDSTPIDVVLLSPAAASLDQFSSYKERGELFTRLALGE